LEYFISVIILICVYIILSSSLDIVFSNAGIFSVSHAAFFGTGALIYAILSKAGISNYFLIISVVVIVASAIGMTIAACTLRIKGDYFIIASFGFQMIAYDIFYNWVRFSSGATVIYAIPKPIIFGIVFDTNAKYIFLTLIITSFCLYVCWRLSKSQFGTILKAIKDDEVAIQATGRNPLIFKVKALVLSGILASIAGMIYSGYLTIFVPYSYNVDLSIAIIAMVIFGGSGNVLGASFGALVLVIIPQLISFLKLPVTIVGPLQQLLYGLLLVIFMRIKPEGLLGKKTLTLK
jgi:branched-chain amino acid transport system permease protein